MTKLINWRGKIQNREFDYKIKRLIRYMKTKTMNRIKISSKIY